MPGKKNSFYETNIIVKKAYTGKNCEVNHRIHTNDGHELYLLLQGDVHFSIEGSIYKLMPYDMLLISNQEIHKPIVNSRLPHERIYLYFDPDYLALFHNMGYDLLQMFENRKSGFGNRINAEIVHKYGLDKYFFEIYEWYISEAPEKQVMMMSLLLQLIVKINTICDDNKDGEEVEKNVQYNDKIYQIIRYISANLDKKINLDELETKFYIDKYYLCHLFKDITGYTLVDYINYKKVLSAKEQLKLGKPLGEIWTQFGFLNYSSFYRTFKKMSRMSPTEYLQKISNMKDKYHIKKGDTQ